MRRRIIDACDAFSLRLVLYNRQPMVVHPDTYTAILLAYYGDPED